jgi:predicted nucleic acid-binding protein
VSVPRAVLDADVIFSRVLHELMGRLAAGVRLFDLVWSEELLGEAKSSLMERKGLTAEVAETWVDHMRREFPDGCVDISAVPGDLDLGSMTRYPGDTHVCALAIAGSADLLFTFDRGYLKDSLRRHGVEVPDLDRFLVERCEEHGEGGIELPIPSIEVAMDSRAHTSTAPAATVTARPTNARGTMSGRSGASEAIISASTGPTKTMLRSETTAMTRKARAISAVVGEREPLALAQSHAAKAMATARYAIASGDWNAGRHSELASEMAGLLKLTR